MYGPKSGSFSASMPGAPLGLPGPGLPILPPEPPLPVPERLADEAPPEPAGEKLGEGENLPPPEAEEPPREPLGAPVTGPPAGPATFGAVVLGTGILNEPFGFCTVLGAVGFSAGRGAGVCIFSWVVPCGFGVSAGFCTGFGAGGASHGIVKAFFVGVGAFCTCFLGC